jgi:hypothetical protein
MTPSSTAHTDHGDGSAFHASYVSIAEIVINAPPSAVWPHLINVGAWIYDFHVERAVGEQGRAGEVQHLWPLEVKVVNGSVSIAAKDRTVANATVMKTVDVVPEKLWYTVNLPKVEDGIRSNGVNLVLLKEIDGKTFVTAIRSKESICPSPEVRDATQAHMIAYQPMAQQRWMTMYLPRLKELSENAR